MKVLAILLLVVVAIRLLVRWLLPVLGRYAVNKASESMKERHKSQSMGPKVYDDGQVEIRKATKKDRPGSTDVEDVDFEEIT